MAEKTKPKTILLKQPAMRRVLLALLPCVAGASTYDYGVVSSLGAIYFFG